MLRDDAVIRIQDGLGFAARQSDKIILRLLEAQRDLEKGKTLPKFLLQESQALVLLTGTSTVALPSGFLRVDDDNPPHFVAPATVSPVFVAIKHNYRDALEANYDDTPSGPKVAVIRNSVIDFIATADTTYNMTWNYYKAAALLTTNIENEWLANASDWLIGMAGLRMARDARDKDAVGIFQSMMTEGRAACFGEIVASEQASGPLVMGANL